MSLLFAHYGMRKRIAGIIFSAMIIKSKIICQIKRIVLQGNDLYIIVTANHRIGGTVQITR